MLLKNTLYQLYGRISSLVFGLASVPTFLHFLGSEAYGVVGLYLSLIALTGLVDMGVPSLPIVRFPFCFLRKLLFCRFQKLFGLWRYLFGRSVLCF